MLKLKLFKSLKFPKYMRKLNSFTNIVCREFLAPAYYCNEVWSSRYSQPLFQKVNLDEFYHELDQKYQKTKSLSFIDVDIFVNAIKDDTFDDEMLDLVHKLRLTSETSGSLPSMSYAVVKTLLNNEKIEELHTVIEDRLNYGIFLDTHITNVLLNHFWNKKDFVSGARIASHSMLQEDPYHPITTSLSLLHCYNCLLNKGEWCQPSPPKEPEEEIKIRVKYIRNQYDDQHFDLKDCKRIIGKTLLYLTKEKNDPINNSFFIVGAALFENIEELQEKLKTSKNDNIKLINEILQLIPEKHEIKDKLNETEVVSKDVNGILETEVNKAVQKCSEKDIASQCELFKQWEQKRIDCLNEKEEVLRKLERMKKVESLQKELKEKETKLWFFENEEKIELEIEEKEELRANESKGSVYKKRSKSSVDEEYIPPTIR